jgi:hypothetical protein
LEINFYLQKFGFCIKAILQNQKIRTMKKLLIFMAFITGLFLTAVPVASAVVDNDVGFSYVLPVDQSPAMIYIETPAQVPITQQIVCPISVGVEKPAVSYFNETGLMIAMTSQCSNSQLTRLGSIHDFDRAKDNYKLSRCTINREMGTGYSRLDIGELI